MDRTNEMEDAALQHAAESTDPDVQLKYLEIAKALSELRKNFSEVKKDELESQGAAIESRLARTRFWASTITPVLALVVTGLTFVLTVRMQSRQFSETAKFQRDQFRQTAEFQRDTNEDSQWKDALQKVSFKDSESALVGVLAMQPFMSKGHYQSQARSIAAASLPMIRNVAAFDEILTEIEELSGKQYQSNLIGISRMISFAQRERHGIVGAAAKKSSGVPPFLVFDIDSIDMDPHFLSKTDPKGTKVAAWELETVSNSMKEFWTDPKMGATPANQNLVAVVLENNSFDNLDFSQADLRIAVLYRASFKNSIFRGANFENVLVQDALLDGADFSRVTRVDGSVWKGTTNWWDAKCVSPELLKHLMSTDPPPVLKVPKTNCE